MAVKLRLNYVTIMRMLLQDSSTTSIIPSVVFSGLISGLVGAGIALLSIYLQNKANDKRQNELLEEQARQQRERLEHESSQKRLDREMIIRRDIYLSGAESIGKMEQYILSFVDVFQTVQTQTAIVSGVNECLNKVALIANYEIIEKLAELQTYYNESITILLEKKMELSNAIEYKVSIDNYIEDLRQKGTQQLSLFDSIINSGDKNQIDSITTKFQEIDAEKRDYESKLAEVKLQTINQHVELMQLSFQTFNKFEIIAAELNLYVRRELNFPIDEQKYIELIKQSNEKTPSVVNWYRNLVEKHKHEL